jgi:hypothetical protein
LRTYARTHTHTRARVGGLSSAAEENLENRYWDFGGSTVVSTNKYIRLTPDRQSKTGWLWSKLVHTHKHKLLKQTQALAHKHTQGVGRGAHTYTHMHIHMHTHTHMHSY